MKKIYFYIIGFVVLVMLGTYTAKATTLDKTINIPLSTIYTMISSATAPLQTAINNLGDRVSSVEATIAGHANDIHWLDNRLSAVESVITTPMPPQPTPPFNLDMDITTQISRDNNPGFRYVGATVRVTSPAQTYSPFNVEHSSLIPETNVWGVAHTPDGDVNSAIFPTWYGPDESTILGFTMPGGGYAYGTEIPIDIYAEYGGRVSHQTIYPNTN